jgi:hypothetical protein
MQGGPAGPGPARMRGSPVRVRFVHFRDHVFALLLARAPSDSESEIVTSLWRSGLHGGPT